MIYPFTSYQHLHIKAVKTAHCNAKIKLPYERGHQLVPENTFSIMTVTPFSRWFKFFLLEICSIFIQSLNFKFDPYT